MWYAMTRILCATTMAARFFPFRPEIDQNFALRNVRVLAAAHAASTSASFETLIPSRDTHSFLFPSTLTGSRD